MSGTQWGLLLLKPIHLKVVRVVASQNDLLHKSKWLFQSVLLFYQLESVGPFSSDL